MVLSKGIVLLVVALAALATSAVAQTNAEGVAVTIDERALAPDAPAGDATVEPATARLLLAGTSAWLHGYLRDAALFASTSARPARPMVTPALQALTLAGPRPVASGNPFGRGIPAVHGRLLPIPMLQWRTRAPLDSRASLAFRPSLVIGRRRTYMPEVFRGSRTFGFALQVRINVGQPAPAPQAPGGASGTALLASKARALMSVVR